jgi:hypothetical protein
LKFLLKRRRFTTVMPIFIILAALCISYTAINNSSNNKSTMVMGAVLNKKGTHEEGQKDETNLTTEERNERFFRPSRLSVLNLKKEAEDLLNNYIAVGQGYIDLPKEMLKNSWDTVLNYYSVLREASLIEENKPGGCGTIGWSGIPYPIAYSFFSKDYRKDTSLKAYTESFKGISHINLVKLRNVTDQTLGNTVKYFIELEVLKPSEEGNTNFLYYYGYVDLKNEDGVYKITNIDLSGEDFLCAPYHGWRYYAELYVDTVYGGWCKLIDKRLPTIQEGYVKNIDIKGTDGKEYRFQFIQLTNGVDIEVGQYVRDISNKWKSIKIDPEKCLKN